MSLDKYMSKLEMQRERSKELMCTKIRIYIHMHIMHEISYQNIARIVHLLEKFLCNSSDTQ